MLQAMPKKLDTPQSRMRAESAQELLKFLEDPYDAIIISFSIIPKTSGIILPSLLQERE